jgi:hypothetical protein
MHSHAASEIILCDVIRHAVSTQTPVPGVTTGGGNGSKKAVRKFKQNRWEGGEKILFSALAYKFFRHKIF